jgi:alpha-L-fucosidase
MQFDHMWQVDAWNPDALMRLYKAAGAKYFVSLACHHDNFDTYNSAHHPWNAVNIGPKRDIVGTWAKVARAHGLRFGVSNHASHAWHWWQTAYGYDAVGPMAGVRYDAYRLRKADGAGKWWAGLDPQQLYTGPSLVIPDGVTSIKEMNAWHDAHDGQWHEEAPPQNPGFTRSWLARCNDLTDRYQPDYVYFDDTGLPLGQAGLDAVAHYYNAAWRRSGGTDVVVTGKKLDQLQLKAIVQDVERGFADELMPDPWQTCTCIGNWHYDRRFFERHGYVPAKSVVQRLCDTVSKNGNLLLSIPVRGNGAIDEDEEKILHDLAGWMAVNGEAIFSTRPWRLYGEGPTKVAGGMFGEETFKGFGAGDIRFTTRGATLYAHVLDDPKADTVTIASLADGVRGQVERVELLGAPGPLEFKRGPDGLTVRLPQTRPTFTPTLKIQGTGLV